MDRRLPVVALLLGVVLAGCSGGGASLPPPTPTYNLPPRSVREDEKALNLPPATNGPTQFTLLGLTTGIALVTGSHAEWDAKGQYVRIRVVVTSSGTSSVLFDTRRQQVLTDQGKVIGSDEQAMLIKRQPQTFDLGPGVRVEFDLYFDIPKNAKPVTLRAFGGPTITDMQNASGTDIKLG